MHQNQETAIAQMREAVRKLGSSTEGYVDATLMRFLIARTLDAEKAAKMFAEWRKWRGSFVPLDCIPHSEIADELDAEKLFLQGLSRKGHPVVICKVNKHFPAKDQLQFKKFVVHVLDKTIARYNVRFSTLIQVADMVVEMHRKVNNGIPFVIANTMPLRGKRC